MTDEKSLDLCPFCRGPAEIDVDDEEFDVARAICQDCGACGPFIDLADHPSTADAKDAARDAWNRRPAKEQTS